jgi:hypothetical protein
MCERSWYSVLPNMQAEQPHIELAGAAAEASIET